MARVDLTIPSLGNNFVDLRDTLPGDAYNWSWTRPLSQVNYLAIHHTAASDTQTPQQIANYHINSNGWGGIGYHFLISKDGIVYYVGDISTARANVANLNEQVIGICLIGNFTDGRLPTDAQVDSAQKLCNFFINDYPNLPNLNSWQVVKGHKELPGQATTCPGNDWSNWKNKLITVPTGGGNTATGGGQPILTPNARRVEIANLYRVILGRDPDQGGLNTYAQGPMTIDQVRKSLTESEEHKQILLAATLVPDLKSQIDGMQTSLASVNQQVIFLQEALQEKEQEIIRLKGGVSLKPVSPKPDTTLTLAGALINLYKFIFWPRKVEG